MDVGCYNGTIDHRSHLFWWFGAYCCFFKHDFSDGFPWSLISEPETSKADTITAMVNYVRCSTASSYHYNVNYLFANPCSIPASLDWCIVSFCDLL